MVLQWTGNKFLSGSWRRSRQKDKKIQSGLSSKINELPEMKENRIVNYLKFRGYYEPEIL